ncbi:M56 family metallopeptidase [Chitinophaga pendula]|uniref:M56 family metallopeptidase n=1 Tax=Chitinophaga TaxID=79328 RepID=UPI000BAF7912|nr:MULTISPECIES: M56 family metallopeptidase [Chitinophaga]ASZ14312.1 hypothetical protein CK934_26880 [Chitinophaga sp. MD30]UCJ08038.1 M56 family metallopeptidase [Chitinophaga pendula]
MGALPVYLMKVILCSGILYAYYLLALRNNRFHQWNRYYLLMATLVSLLVPLLAIPLPRLSTAEAPRVIAYTSHIITLREQLLPRRVPAITYHQVILLIYCLVLIVLLFRIAKAAWKIGRLIRYNPGNYIPPFYFIRSEEVSAPFSFFNYIFWDTVTVPESEHGQQILRHELVHVKDRHSIDKLLLEIVSAVCWINPFFHFYRRELGIIHEFIADHKAAGGQHAEYADAILQMALGSTTSFTLVNPFFHHPLKRRIWMLTSLHTPRFSYLRRIMVLPLTVLIFSSLAFVAEQPLQGLKASLSIPDTIAMQLPAMRSSVLSTRTSATNTPARTVAADKVYYFVEEAPAFPGGESALGSYLGKHIRYPRAAQKAGISGTVFIQFVIDEQGAVTQVRAVGKHHGGGLEEEAVRIVSAMPKWAPGRQDGKAVSVQFNLPIRFTMQENTPAPAVPEAEEVFTFVEQPPAFPGGEKALSDFLYKHLRYPKAANQQQISGTIFIQMQINNDGSISHIKTMGPVKGFGLEEEAIRVIEAMPAWIPGKKDGHNVAVQFNLPIRFTLQ